MKKNPWVIFAIFSLILFQIIDIQAQKIQKNISIQWLSPISYQTDRDETLTFMVFMGSVEDAEFPVLPTYYDHFPVSADFAD